LKIDFPSYNRHTAPSKVRPASKTGERDVEEKVERADELSEEAPEDPEDPVVAFPIGLAVY